MELKHLQNGSDIRGIALDLKTGETVNFTKEDAYALARGFAAWLRKLLKKDDLTIAVGRDSRLSGPELLQAVTDGLLFDGVDVIETGLSTTPAMFMATIFDDVDADGAIMLTASHMPANRKVMKFFYKG